MGDTFLAGGEEPGVAGAVGDHVECGETGDDGREAFKDKEETPWSDWGGDRGDGVGEEAGVCGCERGSGDEEAGAESEFFAAVEEREVEGDARAEGGFKDSKKTAEDGEM